MKRWWLMIGLLLSVGINLGILATLAFQGRSAGSGTPAGVTVGDGATGKGTADEGTADEGTAGEGAAQAGSPEDPLIGEGRRPPVIRRMADSLGLEGDKRAAFTEIQRTFFDQTLAARARMARLQREIRSEVTSDEPDRAALDQLLVELSTAHTDLERAFVTNLLDSRELLDGDQERRFMHFLRRIRQVRGEVERRFRERWRGMEHRERRGPGPRGRRPGGPREPPPPRDGG